MNARQPMLQKITARLTDLMDMKDGWLGQGHTPEGIAPKPVFLLWVGVVAAAVCEGAKCPVPGIFPTPTGGVQLEWPGAELYLEPEMPIRGVASAGADLEGTRDLGVIVPWIRAHVVCD